jgi:hypothetical protein
MKKAHCQEVGITGWTILELSSALIYSRIYIVPFMLENNNIKQGNKNRVSSAPKSEVTLPIVFWLAKKDSLPMSPAAGYPSRNNQEWVAKVCFALWWVTIVKQEEKKRPSNKERSKGQQPNTDGIYTHGRVTFDRTNKWKRSGSMASWPRNVTGRVQQ